MNESMHTPSLPLLPAKSMHAPFLRHMSKAVCDGEGGVNEALHTASQARVGPGVQLAARLIHAFVPAHVGEGVHLQERRNRHKHNTR